MLQKLHQLLLRNVLRLLRILHQLFSNLFTEHITLHYVVVDVRAHTLQVVLLIEEHSHFFAERGWHNSRLSEEVEEVVCIFALPILHLRYFIMNQRFLISVFEPCLLLDHVEVLLFFSVPLLSLRLCSPLPVCLLCLHRMNGLPQRTLLRPVQQVDRSLPQFIFVFLLDALTAQVMGELLFL